MAFSCREPLNSDERFCGVYENIDKRSSSPLDILLVSKKSSFKVNRIERKYSISSTGKSAQVTESFDIQHIGNKLVGNDFSRAELSKLYGSRNQVPQVFSQMRIRIPLNSHSFEVEDALGLNWAYMKKKDAGSKQLFYDVMPRFPLLSGWSYRFSYSYVTSLDQFKESDGHFHFPISGLQYNIPVGEIVVHIILPEDARVKIVDKRNSILKRMKERSFLSTIGDIVYEFTFHPTTTADTQSSLSLGLSIPIWAKFRKPLIGLVLVVISAVLFGRLLQSGSINDQINNLLDERKLLVMNGMETTKIDSEIDGIVKSLPKSDDVSKLLQLRTDHTTVDSIHDSVRLMLN